MQKNRHLSKKIDIIQLYLYGYNTRLSGREIARKTMLNHQTALNSLNELVRDKVLKFEIAGRNKQYSLNMDNPSAMIMAEMAESQKALAILLNKKIKVIIAEMLPFAETFIIFGSYASGREKDDSDLDIVIAGKADKQKIKSIASKYPIEANIEFVSFGEFEKALKEKKALALEILRNHVIFGDAHKIIEIYWRWHK